MTAPEFQYEATLIESLPNPVVIEEGKWAVNPAHVVDVGLFESAGPEKSRVNIRMTSGIIHSVFDKTFEEVLDIINGVTPDEEGGR